MPTCLPVQHHDIYGHLLMHLMAMLWDGGAAGCRGLYRHLSLVGMCTSVLGAKLRAFATGPRRLSRECGPDGTTAGRRHREPLHRAATTCRGLGSRLTGKVTESWF